MITTHADPLDRAAELEEAERSAGAYEVRSRLALNGSDECEDCGVDIPSARRIAAPWATRCFDCQELAEVTG